MISLGEIDVKSASAFIMEPVLRDLVAKMVIAVQPIKVILFGSYARGTALPQSDIDFMVITDTVGFNRYELAKRIYSSIRGRKNAVDVLVYSQAEFIQWQYETDHVIGRAVLEGVVLYERT